MSLGFIAKPTFMTLLHPELPQRPVPEAEPATSNQSGRQATEGGVLGAFVQAQWKFVPQLPQDAQPPLTQAALGAQFPQPETSQVTAVVS
jgi:hypothetical protein